MPKQILIFRGEAKLAAASPPFCITATPAVCNHNASVSTEETLATNDQNNIISHECEEQFGDDISIEGVPLFLYHEKLPLTNIGEWCKFTLSKKIGCTQWKSRILCPSVMPK